MILLNFTHPLTPAQRAQIEALAGQPLDRIIDQAAQFDHGRPFAAQVAELVDRLELTPAQWQSEVLLVNPPALNFIAVTLLAELHGRMGYFPPVLRLRPVDGALLAHLRGRRDHPAAGRARRRAGPKAMRQEGPPCRRCT